MNFKQDLDKIKDFPEYKLFFLLDECNYYISIGNETLKMNEDMSDDERNVFIESMVKVRNIRKHVTDEITNRKGFKCYTETMAMTEEFINWFYDWHHWREELTEEQWEDVQEKLSKGEDIKEYITNEI